MVNLSLLIAHEIDSGFQKEWEFFHFPGGAGGFVLLHVPLVAIFLIGYRQLVRGERGGRWFSAALAAMGISAFAIHMVFIALGHPEFRSPASTGLLAAAFVGSSIQGWLVIGGREGRR